MLNRTGGDDGNHSHEVDTLTTDRNKNGRGITPNNMLDDDRDKEGGSDDDAIQIGYQSNQKLIKDGTGKKGDDVEL